jgi:hypothetical protein
VSEQLVHASASFTLDTLLACASAYAGRSCFKDGSGPAERPFVVTHLPAKAPKCQQPNVPFCEQRKEAVDLVFVTEFGTPVNVNSLVYKVYKHFKPTLKRAGLPNIRLYDLRHTAATLALSVGVTKGCVGATRAYKRSFHIGSVLTCVATHAG